MSRESSAIFGNNSGIGPFVDTFWQPKEGSQLQRAALICWVAIRYWLLLRQEQRQVDRSRVKRVWSMTILVNVQYL
ncbi:hypothetical protein LSAT2_029324 [Lamellibrachia satsuma]|nr:hypothetical protein LSAT2_029324 [Lamellibrachia satsuma]